MDAQNNEANIMGASFNLMRRMPPRDVPKNLGAISTLIESEDLQDEVQ